jgi:transposase
MSFKKYNVKSSRNDPASRFDKRLIIQIVQEVEAGLPRKKACLKYGMSYTTIGEWMKTYCSESYKVNLRSVVSAQQRRKAVRLVQEEKITKQQASELCKVSKKTITTWLRLAKREEADLVRSNHNDMPIDPAISSQIDFPGQLNEARLKIKALETMIDIAEDQFKISIRKKPGAKQ